MGDETAAGDAILALAHCPCGHAVPLHDEGGCPGALATFCMCVLSSSEALDAAIERVRRLSVARVDRVSPNRSISGAFDVDTMRLELDSDDYERVGPIRTLAPATLIALFANRLVRPQ